LIRETLAESGTHGTGSNEKSHYVASWDRFCPLCGEPNPSFVDEVRCKDCKRPLGSRETAQKLKACPTCGGHEAERIS
jgi:hypothetical protein